MTSYNIRPSSQEDIIFDDKEDNATVPVLAIYSSRPPTPHDVWITILQLILMKISRQHGHWSCLTNQRRRRLTLIGVLITCWCAFFGLEGDDPFPTVLSDELEEQLKSQPRRPVVPDPTHNLDALPVSSGLSFPISPGTKKVVWSQARGDRSGSFIQDMLMCHAYAFHKNYTYGGVCGRNTNLQFKSLHKELIDAVGLSKVLKFNCPPPNVELQYRGDYIQNDTEIFTSEYIDYLQRLIEYPTKPKHRTIAVHMRRGDITPCRPRTRGYPRYLPNQHFLRLIDRYNPHNDSEVFVYSESTSFEKFDEFREKGYHVVLDGSIGEVWKGILLSDVAILSRSSFSLVPAIMTKGIVVFTPFWHKPLPGWDIVEEAFVNETLTEFRRLKSTCPAKNGKKN